MKLFSIFEKKLMKKILFFVLLSNFLAAQHPDLLNTDWKITKIVSDIRPDLYPPSAPVTNLTTFRTSEPQLSSSFYNGVSGNLNYNGQDNFTVNSRACTLADYMDDNGEVNQFFGAMCSFFGSTGPFYYFIQNNGSEKTMVISTPIFDAIHFSAVNLATENVEKSQIILAPNPVKDFLSIENKNGISSVAIFDASGKLMLEENGQNTKTLKINMQNFSSGIYLIKVNEEKTFKIIKK